MIVSIIVDASTGAQTYEKKTDLWFVRPLDLDRTNTGRSRTGYLASLMKRKFESRKWVACRRLIIKRKMCGVSARTISELFC
jgi:hypothetical protein